MKAINKILMGLAVATALVGCKDGQTNAEPAAPETNPIQAYIFANTSDITIKPAGGDTVAITWSEGTYESLDKVFPVLIGRNVTSVAAMLPLSIEMDEEVFACDTAIEFAKGQAVDTLWIATALEFGQSDKLTITIPQEFSTKYGSQSIKINVNVDYTWLPAGTVTMSSQWEAASATVAIEKAKEYSDEDGNGLYHLVSPYYYIAPDYCTEEGYHLSFLLDKDYNAVDLQGGMWIQVENTGYDWYYWNTKKFGDYDYFVNSTNQYVISVLWSNGVSIYGPYIESFVWDNGYPGELVDPQEGDSKLSNIVFTSASYEVEVDEYGDPVTVDEVLDPVKYAADKYVFPESYIGHFLYYVTLTGAQGTMQLELVGDQIDGEYTFANYATDDNGNLIGNAGTATPGAWNGMSVDGCYLKTALSQYYLTDGVINITPDSTVMTVVSPSGTEITASYKGAIEKAKAPARKSPRLFTK